MNDFKAIYRILRYLSAAMSAEEYDPGAISPERLKLPAERIEQIMILLQQDGYISGLAVTQTLGDSYPHIADGSVPRITLKGLEYLEENSMMKKAARAVKEIAEIGNLIP